MKRTATTATTPLTLKPQPFALSLIRRIIKLVMGNRRTGYGGKRQMAKGRWEGKKQMAVGNDD